MLEGGGRVRGGGDGVVEGHVVLCSVVITYGVKEPYTLVPKLKEPDAPNLSKKNHLPAIYLPNSPFARLKGQVVRVD